MGLKFTSAVQSFIQRDHHSVSDGLGVLSNFGCVYSLSVRWGIIVRLRMTKFFVFDKGLVATFFFGRFSKLRVDVQ